MRPTITLVWVAALFAAAARAGEDDSGEFTGGRIPEKYLGQTQEGAKRSATAGVAGNVSADENVRISEPDRGGNNECAIGSNGRGGIIIGWQDSGTGRCCYITSGDWGETWNEEHCLGPQSSGGHAGDASAGASPDGALYAVCQDYSISQVRISHTQDNGKTWSEWKSVQSAPDKPWVAGGKGGMVYISWLGDEAGWKRSRDFGETWEPVKSLGFINHGTTFGVGGDYVHVLFNQGRGLSYQRSVDGGMTAEPRKVLVSNQGSFCWSPCSPRMHPIVGGGASPDGKVVVAVWASTLDAPGSDGDDDVWAVISRDYGETWTSPIRVNNNATPSRQFQAWGAADIFGRVHVVWTDLRHSGDYAVYYASTLEDEFDENVEITDERSRASGFYGDYKGLTVEGEDVLVAWNDSREGGSQIYFSRGKGLAADPQPTAVELTSREIKARWKTKSIYNIKGARKGEPDKAVHLPMGKYLGK